MPFIDNIGDFLKTMKVYLLGKGLLTLAVMAATMVGGVTLPLIVITGGTLFSGIMRLHEQKLYEDNMVDLYRDDIAKSLGIQPQDVTRDDLKTVAADNDVIGQALARQRRKNIVSFATSALAAVVSFGVIFIGLDNKTELFGKELVARFAEMFGPAAKIFQYLSVGVVSSTSSLIFHNGLEMAIGKGSGMSKAVAHDLIVEMNTHLHKGLNITPEQVYTVLVTKDSQLGAEITTRFHEPYEHMTQRKQRAVLTQLGIFDEIQEISDMLSAGELPVGHLAYMIGSMQPTRAPKPEAEAAEKSKGIGHFVERFANKPKDGENKIKALANRPKEKSKIKKLLDDTVETVAEWAL